MITRSRIHLSSPFSAPYMPSSGDKALFARFRRRAALRAKSPLAGADEARTTAPLQKQKAALVARPPAAPLAPDQAIASARTGILLVTLAELPTVTLVFSHIMMDSPLLALPLGVLGFVGIRKQYAGYARQLEDAKVEQNRRRYSH